MHDVQSWIATSGERIMLIYGQNDPWSAGAVDIGAATDSFKFIAPSGNHGSSITTLTTANAETATAAVLRWAGLPAMAMAKARTRLDARELTVEQEKLPLRPGR